MIHNLKVKLAIWLINLGIKMLPDNYQSYAFISNCMKVNIIRVKDSTNE
ncbi:hypothetical protein [Vibrio phage LP.2]|nr:hypothetical protein [Vibrio phage LP.2]